MSDALLLLDVEDGIARITLNRPAVGNALDLALARELLAAVIRCDTDPAIRCVLLAANGRLFCAGGDVASFATAGDQAPALLSELAGTLHMAVTRLARMRKPMVAQVQGPAAGAGFGLSLLADVVIAGRAANFTPAYGAIGLTPDGGLTWLLPRIVGMRRAQDIILNNRRVSSDEAEHIGLVTRVVDDEQLADEALAAARKLAASAVEALGATRALLLESSTTSLETMLELEVRSISASGGKPEFREGLAAFVEKRKPDFSRI